MDKPIMVLKKKADKGVNKIIIPKAIIEQWGRYFNLEIYNDYMKLIPIKEEK